MKCFKTLFTLLIFSVNIVAYSTVTAQHIPAGTAVDQYSDAQIKQLLQQTQAQQGLSDAQIIQPAQSRGLGAAELVGISTSFASLGAIIYRYN